MAKEQKAEQGGYAADELAYMEQGVEKVEAPKEEVKAEEVK